MASKGTAFSRGALGCLGIFILLALFTAIAGGYVQINLGGFILLIVIGGGIGLVANSIYQKGRNDAEEDRLSGWSGPDPEDEDDQDPNR